MLTTELRNQVVDSLTEAFWFQEGPGVRNWQFTTSGIKLLNVANIEKSGTLNLAKTDRHLDEAEVAKKYSHFLVDAGDLVIASSAISFDDDGLLRTRGAFVGRQHLPLCLNTSTIRFKAIEGISDLRFLRLWFNGHDFRSQITKLVTGTAQQNFGPSHLKATKIALPPLAEQRRIAEVLDRAEALRAKRRAALAQLDTLTQSVFLDLFGDPATNPMGWKAKPLRELVSEFRYGTSNKSQASGKPALRIPNVIGGIIDVSDLKLVPVDTGEFERLRLIEGDVLFVRTNGNPDFVGRCAVFDVSVTARSGFPSDAFIFASYLIRARLEVDQITPIFLREFMLGTEGRRELRSRSKTSAGQFNINTENLGAIAVPLPPLPLQRDFACRVAAVERLKAAHSASLAEMDALFASLQHRAFRGEL